MTTINSTFVRSYFFFFALQSWRPAVPEKLCELVKSITTTSECLPFPNCIYHINVPILYYTHELLLQKMRRVTKRRNGCLFQLSLLLTDTHFIFVRCCNCCCRCYFSGFCCCCSVIIIAAEWVSNRNAIYADQNLVYTYIDYIWMRHRKNIYILWNK